MKTIQVGSCMACPNLRYLRSGPRETAECDAFGFEVENVRVIDPGCKLADSEEELKKALCRFFEILDMEDSTDEGRVFKPTYIACGRAMQQMELGTLLKQMKELSNYKEGKSE